MPARRLDPARGRSATHQHLSGTVSSLLAAWQDTGDHATLGSLVAVIREDCLWTISRLLRRLGIRDPDAVEDAFALVLGHLRRLPGTHGERSVSRFQVATDIIGGDQGEAFVRWLCQERARDVARSIRRRARRFPFTDLEATRQHVLDNRALDAADGLALPTVDESLIRAAVTRLDSRQRTVVELLLEGKNQVVIAHVLGASEGTVSRIRARAIAALRVALDAARPAR